MRLSSQAEVAIDAIELPSTAVGSSELEHSASRVPGKLLLEIKKSLREPLVHFLLAGAMLLGASSFFGRLTAPGARQNRIPVSAAEIRRLREV